MAALRYDELAVMRRTHPAWRLLAADNGPLVLAFAVQVFLEPNVRSLPGPDAVEALEDYLTALRVVEPDAYPKSAEA